LPKDIDYFEFEKDLRTRKAIERNIEIIGEALNRILKAYPDISISDSRKIVDTRNRIIHGYDSITPDILWLIIKQSLPVLRNEVAELLK
jgi:uncharacterized protein with HEPN domain